MRRSLGALAWLAVTAPAVVGCVAGPWLAGAKPPASASAAPAVPPAIERGLLVIHADFALPPDNFLINELVAERQLIADRLGVPAADKQVHIYLYAEEAAYRTVVTALFPGFAERRAVFVDNPAQLAVYAHWNDRVAEDLRHEVAHGYLHAAVPNLPPWLDEGLAEYFEVGPQRAGLNAAHVAYLRNQLAANAWRPNLPRLEGLTAAAMTQADYAEAWLWVHWMLATPLDQPSPLTPHLAGLAAGQPSAPLSSTIAQRWPQADAALVEHLRRLP